MDLISIVAFGFVASLAGFVVVAALWLYVAVPVLARWATEYMGTHRTDFTITYKRDGGKTVYLDRWHLIPRNDRFNVYLHCAYADDESHDLHDHPYDNMSIVLKGGYWEHFNLFDAIWRAPGAIIFRRAATAHRLTLERTAENAAPTPSVSLFVTGPRTREWGFHAPDGWLPYKEYHARDNHVYGDNVQ